MQKLVLYLVSFDDFLFDAILAIKIKGISRMERFISKVPSIDNSFNLFLRNFVKLASPSYVGE